MEQGSPDQQLRFELMQIPEVEAAGFSVREGLTGDGITILKGRSYFGSWRMSLGNLVWVSANSAEPHQPADTVAEAARRTLLMILRELQDDMAGLMQRRSPPAAVTAGHYTHYVRPELRHHAR